MDTTIVQHSSWAKSASGAAIELFTCKKNNSPILFIGGVHGDEPEGVRLAQDLLFWLQKNNKHVQHSWSLIPCLNVDGFSKNPATRTNGNGVDLNRNFPTADWSADHKGPRYFPGPKPSSEPEVQAVCALVKSLRPKLIVHFHSWEPCVVYTGAPGRIFAEVLSTGTNYPAKEDIGYPTPGSLGQYGWTVHQTPVICIEAPEKSDLSLVWSRFQEGLVKLLCEPGLFPKIKG